MPKHSRSSSSSTASPMTPSSSSDQTELEERKARKRIQNRMAQRLYRQRQRQRIEDLRAKLENQQDTYSEMITPPESVGHGRRQSTKDLGFNGFLTAPAILQQDPFSAIFDPAPVDSNHSPMSGNCLSVMPYDESNNATTTGIPSTESSLNGVAPVAWMGYMDPMDQDIWASDLSSLDLNFFDQGPMNSEFLAPAQLTFSRSMPDLSTQCVVTPQPLVTTTIHDIAGPQQCPGTGQSSLMSAPTEHWIPVASERQNQQSSSGKVQTQVDDACILSTSGVAMLQDLLTTATDAQRQLCPTGNCITPQVTEEQTSKEDQTICEHGKTFSPMTGGSGVKSAEALDALLPDVRGTASDHLSTGGSDRRLPRLVATVRHALDEWRKWESDGFPLD